MIRLIDIEKSASASSVLFTDALGTPNYITKSQLFNIAAGFAKVGFGQSTLESPLSLSDDKYTLGTLGVGVITPTEKLDVSGWIRSFGNVFEIQTIDPTAPSSGLKLYSNSSNNLSWRKSDGFIRTLYDSNTANRSYQLPDNNGTIALLSDITSALVWGSITGTLSNQTDLQNALNLKLSSTTAASTYVPFTGGTLTGQLTLFNSIRIGGTGVNDNNIYFGKNSFISRTSGTNNTALGSSSLGSLTSGSNNVAIGNNAGGAVTSGSTNILIGANVANGITIGSKNTIIGSNIAALTPGLSNTIILADGDGNRRLNIFSDGNTMIGTNTYYGETRLGIFGGVSGANVDVRGNSGAFVDQSTIELEGADYDTNTRSTYLQYRGSTYTGTTNGFSNNNLARLVLNGDNNLIWSVFASPIIFGTNDLERMRLLSNGNVLINKTTDNGDKFQVNGNINISDSSSLKFGAGSQYISNNSGTSTLNFGSNGSTNMSIVNGNVLINTLIDSEYKLDVNGTGRFSGDLRVSKTDPNFSLVNTTSSTTLNLYSGSVASYSFNNPNGHWFQTESVYRLKIMSSAVSISNNLGIGTETPETRLDVNGDLKVVNGAKFVGQAGSWYNGTQVLVDYASAGRIQAYDGSVSLAKNLILQWAGGQVGIGTTTPSSLLHIANATNAQLNIDALGTSNGTRIRFLNAATNYNWQIATQQNVGDTFEITSSTVVGGDTFTTPSLKLSAGGTLTVNNLNLTGINSYNYYTNNANGINPLFSSGFAQSWNRSGGGGEVNFIVNKGAGSVGGFEFGSWNGTTYSGLIKLLDNGNFGIGTTSPTYLLHVKSTNATVFAESQDGTTGIRINAQSGVALLETTTNSDLRIRTNSVERMRILLNGNVGIGTTVPNYRLQINDVTSGNVGINSNGTFHINYQSEAVPRITIDRDAVGSGNAGIIFKTGSTGTNAANGSAIGSPASQKLALYTSNGTVLTERMIIDGSGNIGIGTSLPTNQLHLKSGNPVIRLEGSTTSGFLDFNDSRLHVHAGNGYLALIAGSSERLRIASSGNVLIGTSVDAGTKLYVNGSARFEGAAYFGTNLWNASIDGKARFYFANNSTTYFASPAGFAFRNGSDIDVAIINNSGNLSLALNGVVHDPYGAVSVTQSTTSSYSYYGLTRAGSIGMGMGITTSNQFFIGATTAGGTNSILNGYYMLLTASVAQFNGSVNTPSYLINGNTVADVNGNYTRVFDSLSSRTAIYFGNSSDPTNYYDNTSHSFRSRDGGTTFINISANGIRLQNYTTTQVNALTGSNGNMVFDTTTSNVKVYAGSSWKTLKQSVSVGEVLTMKMLSNSDVTLTTTTGTTTSYSTFASVSYTPQSASSHLVIECFFAYTVGGGGSDSYIANIEVDATEIGTSKSTIDSFDRTSQLNPVVGRYTNSSTTAKTINVRMKRNSADDDITILNDNSFWLKITEISR